MKGGIKLSLAMCQFHRQISTTQLIQPLASLSLYYGTLHMFKLIHGAHAHTKVANIFQF